MLRRSVPICSPTRVRRIPVMPTTTPSTSSAPTACRSSILAAARFAHRRWGSAFGFTGGVAAAREHRNDINSNSLVFRLEYGPLPDVVHRRRRGRGRGAHPRVRRGLARRRPQGRPPRQRLLVDARVHPRGVVALHRHLPRPQQPVRPSRTVDARNIARGRRHIYRTDENGAITISTDGTRFSAQAFLSR